MRQEKHRETGMLQWFVNSLGIVRSKPMRSLLRHWSRTTAKWAGLKDLHIIDDLLLNLKSTWSVTQSSKASDFN